MLNERIFQDRVDGARAKVKRIAESEMKASRLGHARKAAEYADVRMGMEEILAIFLMPEEPVSPREQIDDPTPTDRNAGREAARAALDAVNAWWFCPCRRGGKKCLLALGTEEHERHVRRAVEAALKGDS